jgi:hypothetical protein
MKNIVDVFTALHEDKIDYEKHPWPSCISSRELLAFTFGQSLYNRRIASHLKNCDLCHIVLDGILHAYHYDLPTLVIYSLDNYCQPMKDDLRQKIDEHLNQCVFCDRVLTYIERQTPIEQFKIKNGVKSTIRQLQAYMRDWMKHKNSLSLLDIDTLSAMTGYYTELQQPSR